MVWVTRMAAVLALLLLAVLWGVGWCIQGFLGQERSGVMSYVTDYRDFEFIQYSGNVVDKGQKKDIYLQKSTGKRWLLSERFGFYEFSSYLAGGLYKLMLGGRAPTMALIRQEDGSYRLGSEFIENFHNVGEFFGEQGEDLIAYSFKAQQDGKEDLPSLSQGQMLLLRQVAFGLEDVIAAAIIIGDNDLHKKNVGLVPSAEHPGKYVFAKVDHDLCFYLVQYLDTLGKQGVPVFERLVFDPSMVDLRALSEAFERIAQIDDRIWEASIRVRLADLKNTGAFDAETLNVYEHARWWKGDVFPGDRDLLTIMMERKKQAPYYAQSLKVEACIQAGDLAGLKALIASGEVDVAGKYHSLLLPEGLAGPISIETMAPGDGQTEIFAYVESL